MNALNIYNQQITIFNKKIVLIFSVLCLFLFSFSIKSVAQNSTCNSVQVEGVFNDPPIGDYFQGITINNLSAPIQIIKIYNSRWELIKECSGDCTSLSTYEAEAGKYYVQIQLYTANWEWICQTDNFEVIVPSESIPIRICDNVTISGVYEKDPSNGSTFHGIKVTIPVGRIRVDYKIYDSNMNLLPNVTFFDSFNFEYASGAGKFFVEVKQYTLPRIFGEAPMLICETGKVPVEVPEEDDGGNGEKLCDNVEVMATPASELQGTIQISGLDAPIEIVKIFNEQYQVVFECNNNCDDFIIYPVNSVGKYYVQVQMYDANWQWICQTENIQVEVVINPDCSANLLRDQDGDGYCEGEDCDDNDSNIGGSQAPGTACDDGNPNTTDDKIQADGCTCMGTPDIGIPDCNAVEIFELFAEIPTPGIAFYGVRNLNAPIEIVKIFNRRTYEKIYECNNDCGEGFELELQEGEYVLDLQMYTANWELICSKNIEFDVTTTDPPTCNYLATAGLIDLCSACVSEVAIYIYQGETYFVHLADNINCADAQTIAYACSDGSQFCVEGGLIGSTECVPFFATAVKIETVWQKDQNCCICTTEYAPVCGSDGNTYSNACVAACAGVTTWIPGECENTNPNCNNITADLRIGLADTYEGLGISGLNAPIEIVKVYDARWKLVYECSANCSNPIVIPLADLIPGLHRVQVQMFTANWEEICTSDYLEVFYPMTASGIRAVSNDILDMATYRKEQNVQIEWIAGQVANTNYFVVEHSDGGQNYTEIARIEIAERNSRYFQWTDKHPQLGTNHYRIQQVFYNNKNRHSSTKKVDFYLDEKEITLFPNPVQNHLMLQTKVLMGRKGSIQIFNAFGQQVVQTPAQVFDQEYESIQVDEFENGLYYLHLQADGMRPIAKKFLIEKWK